MNVLILAAGRRDNAESQAYPIWLSEVDGRLLLERQISSLKPLRPSRIVVCATAEDSITHHVENILSMISDQAVLVQVRRPTAGAACTALLAIGHINLDEELIIISATDQINTDITPYVQHFRDSGADGGVLTSESLHPRYSYVRLDETGVVVEVAEKKPITRDANTGFYWLRNSGDFFEALKSMILKDAHVNGSFYIAPALNELILRQKVIRNIRVPRDFYFPIKSDRHLDTYEQAVEFRGAQ